MKTTIHIDDQLLTEAKKYAAETGQTLNAVVEDALRQALAAPSVSAKHRLVHLKTVGGNGPLPGINLDKTSAVLDVMESGSDPR
ncbi:type II toxin-antitoxin system VapB family antitoxin [Candidatus Entotheonella palauensis]|uniref:type II toxin-antitoxin system VapB family antitoxin n=1 Tax=Candidatus Entotheonella palauensis TaxID=93172 RepID=UPI000B7D3B9F|nr:type II toxin-antitoxin system VapB family antitoxin [Candidatus Entotheonella palauensis]